MARTIIGRDLTLLAAFDAQIAEADKHLAALLPRTPFAVLWSGPGWRVVRAASSGAAVGDPARWPSARQVYRASGLCPATYASAGRRHDGAISREGSVTLRRAVLSLGWGCGGWTPPPGDLASQLGGGAAQRGLEPLRLADEGAGNPVGVPGELGVDRAVALDDQLGGPRPALGLDPQRLASAHSTADESAQHVTATLVARQDAGLVAEDEHGAAQLVGEDPQRPHELGAGGALVDGGGAEAGDALVDGIQRWGLVDAGSAIEDGQGPLQPHAGIDVGLWQREQLAATALEGDEHVVPDLHEPSAVARAGPAPGVTPLAGDAGGVDEDLGVGTAGALGPQRRPGQCRWFAGTSGNRRAACRRGGVGRAGTAGADARRRW
jgi:hypothetical protein